MSRTPKPFRVQTLTRAGVWVTRSRHADSEQGRVDASTEIAWHAVNGRTVRSFDTRKATP